MSRAIRTGMEEEMKSYLKRTGHYIDSPENLPAKDMVRYDSRPYSPESIVGLIAHTLFSRTPRSNFYTDGDTIFVPYVDKKDRIVSDADIYQGEFLDDLISEYAIFKILGMRSTRLPKFERVGHSIRLNEFQGLPQMGDDAYANFLNLTTDKASLAYADESQKLRKRIERNSSELHDFLKTLKDIGGIYGSKAEHIKINLSDYLALSKSERAVSSSSGSTF